MRIVLTIILGAVALSLQAQSSISFGNKIDSVGFGETVRLPLRINGDMNNIASIDFSPLTEMYNMMYPQDSSRLEKIMDVTIGENSYGIAEGQLVVQGDKLTSPSGYVDIKVYTIGYAEVPPPIVSLKDSTDMLPLQRSILLVTPPEGFQGVQLDSLMLEHIKPIKEEGTHWTDFLHFLYILGGILALAGLAYFFSKKKREEYEDEQIIEEIYVPAHEKALAALAQLESQQLWQQGHNKEYQSELTRIMRTYVGDRYDVPAMEMTTAQLSQSLQRLTLDSELIKSMSDILQIADIVKFAKGKTGPELNKQFMQQAYDWVDQTKLIETDEPE